MMKIKKLIITMFAAASLIIPANAIIHYANASDDARFTVSDFTRDETGVITTADGQKWYRVKNFDDNKDYIICAAAPDGTQVMLTVNDEDNDEYIWRYYRRTMVPSTYSRYASLSTYSHYLSCLEGKLSFFYRESTVSDMFWETCGSALRYTEGDSFRYLKYDADADEPFSLTEDPDEAADVSIYTKGDTLERCIKVHPCSEKYIYEGSSYPAPEFSVTLSDENIVTDKITWSVDGTKYETGSLTFTADELTGKPAGVHRVNCLVEGHDANGVFYRERSADALFVVTKGTVPDSVISFSDVHEEYNLIGDAIENIIKRTDGYIPALIVCTGDLVNGPTPDSERMLDKYYPLIKPQLGGIDTVFVSGNHDPAKAASEMSVKAGLGAKDDLPASGGLIFDGKSPDTKANGKSSINDKNIRVYSINYEAAVIMDGYLMTYSYENVISDMEKFLEKTAQNYNGELIIISAHSGLHVLGMSDGSANPYGYGISPWIGENAYNLDKSYELAKVINSYADKYNMNIVYLFGHDHSRQEAEMFLTEGDTLTSTKSYYERTYGTLPLHFTYGHSGYLSTSIGSADSCFSFIYRDGDKYSFDLIRTYDNTVRHTEIADRYEASVPAVTETTTQTEITTETQKTDNSETTPAQNESEQTKNTPSANTAPAGTSAPASAETETTSGTADNTVNNNGTDLPATGRNTPAAVILTGNALMLLVIGSSAVKRSRKK